MDTSASDIIFDESGVCNFCTELSSRYDSVINKSHDIRRAELDSFVSRLKADGRGKKYDCIVGVSGGVDSSWTLVKAVELGLRPLAVHMDNGWNSELAQNNIAKIIEKLGIDLFTYVIEWNEYRQLMQDFFEADVIDVELLYDNAMLAVNYINASKYKLKSICSGSNFATEGMSMPENWNWFKLDKRNIKGIIKAHSGRQLKSFPAIGVLKYSYYRYIKGIKWTPFLDYFDYIKEESVKELVEQYDFKPYPYKHYESVFTRFYQGYILPEKFGIDKRRLHLSSLILADQLSRSSALSELEHSPYPVRQELENDKIYFLKKMGWKESDLNAYLSRAEKPHSMFLSEKKLWQFLVGLKSHLKRG